MASPSSSARRSCGCSRIWFRHASASSFVMITRGVSIIIHMPTCASLLHSTNSHHVPGSRDFPSSCALGCFIRALDFTSLLHSTSSHHVTNSRDSTVSYAKWCSSPRLTSQAYFTPQAQTTPQAHATPQFHAPLFSIRALDSTSLLHSTSSHHVRSWSVHTVRQILAWFTGALGNASLLLSTGSDVSMDECV